MSKQIEMEFSYLETDVISEPIFPQDLLANIIETRVSYAAGLNFDSGLATKATKLSEIKNPLNPKI